MNRETAAFRHLPPSSAVRHSAFGVHHPVCIFLSFTFVPFPSPLSLTSFISLSARDRSFVLSFPCRRSFLPRSAPAASPRASLLRRHPTFVVAYPTPTPPKSLLERRPSRSGTAGRPEFFSLPLVVRDTRALLPQRIHDAEVVGRGGGSLRTCEHPSPGLPARYRRADSTTPRYECTYNGCHPDGFQPSVARRTCACLRQFGIDYSFYRITLRRADGSMPNRRSSASRDTHTYTYRHTHTQVTRFSR